MATDRRDSAEAGAAAIERPLITACMVVRHEEAVIDRALTSIRGAADEIIVIHDGPCEDRTLDIARAHGARVAELPRAGHSERHSATAFEWARGDWLLWIDGDEFLSDAMRDGVRELARSPDVDAYEFLEPLWDGRRYLTATGPYKRAMFRRSAAHFIGHIHGEVRVDGAVRRVPLRLEHQPTYNNYGMRTVVTKWRRWARVHARELLTPLDQFPRFNVEGPVAWPRRRRIVNDVSPLLLPVYPLLVLAEMGWKNRVNFPLGQNLRFTAWWAAYSTLVLAYVVRYRYIDPLLRRA